MSAHLVRVERDDGTIAHYGPMTEASAWQAVEALSSVASVSAVDAQPLHSSTSLTREWGDWRRIAGSGRFSSGDAR